MLAHLRGPAGVAITIAVSCVLGVCGCSPEPQQSTLFDHDHAMPSHWPNSLGDLTVQIRRRLELLDVHESCAAELSDLVAWTPEIAADTSMSETQWNRIYEASESLRLRLENSNGQWNREACDQAEQLCVLIDAAWHQLPEDEQRKGIEPHHGHSEGHSHDHSDDHDSGHRDHAHGDHPNRSTASEP